MQNLSFTRNILKKSFALLALSVALVSLAGCGSGAATDGTNTGNGTTPPQIPASISLVASAPSVQSDGNSSITLTVSVLDSGNAAIPNQQVQVAATAGALTASTITTGAVGSATATVSFSGGANGLNQTAVITASISGSTVTRSIPIAITGSTLTLTSSATAAIAGLPITLTAAAKNSAGALLSGQTVRFSIASGSGTLSATTVATGGVGTASTNLTGTAAGTVNVLAEWLDSSNNVTASATGVYTITASAGTAFQVTTPATSPFAVALGGSTNVAVTVPATINGVAVSNVRFATTLGTWQSSGLSVTTVSAAAAANQTFLAGNNAGIANVQIDALNAAGASIASATLTLALSAPAANANNITLVPAPATIPPSSGTNISTSILTATVRDVNNNPVSNAPVQFQLVNPTGSGAQISPVVVLTGDGTNGSVAGQAQSTYTAGTTSTNQQSQVRATLVNNTSIQATAAITVGGTAGSIVVGGSTTGTAINNDTAYQLPMSVVVSDSNGNAVANAVVSVSVWPQSYYKGVRGTTDAPTSCNMTVIGTSVGGIVIPTPFPNEDVNENLILDPGEDRDGPGGFTNSPGFLGSPDGALWPPAASVTAAGLNNGTIVTGSDGTATFSLIYLKAYANWVSARVRASAPVSGTETVTTYVTQLLPSATDAQTTPCVLPDSPFN